MGKGFTARGVVVGNPVADEIRRDGALVRRAVGGTATYASLALRALGLDVTLAGVVGDDHAKMLREPLVRAGVELSHCSVVPVPSTSYLLNYRGSERDVRLLARGPRIRARDVGAAPANAAFIHIGVVAGEADPGTVQRLREWELPMGVDLHVLRGFDPGGAMRLRCAEETGLPFATFDTVKGALAELRAFAPAASSLDECMRGVMALGVRTVIATDGNRGALVLDSGEMSYVPAFPVTEVDATGAGDVFLAGFLFARHVLAEPATSAAAFAAAAASFVVEGPGSSILGSFEAVEQRRGAIAPRAVTLDDRLVWQLEGWRR